VAASEHRKAILEALDQLPPLHQVAQKLIALMNDDRSCARDIDKLVRHDQALTARILKLANSSVYGKSRNIIQLTEAIILLGHTTITNMVLGISVGDVVAGSRHQEFAARAWEHSLDCAAVSRALADITGCVEPENAFVTGLLHDIGLLVQVHAVPEVLAEIVAAEPVDLLAAERQAMGLNHAQIGMKLLNKWRLPVHLCEAVRFHHAPDKRFLRTNPLVIIVALADQLTAIAGTTPFPRQNGAEIFRLLNTLGIEAARFDQMFNALRQSRESTRDLLDAAQLSNHQFTDQITVPDEMPPVTIYAADDQHLAWYTSVLKHLGLSVTAWPSLVAEYPDAEQPEQIVVDFHGATPAQRQMLDQVVRQRNLAPVVLGDIRHTPPEPHWQRVPHLAEQFNRQEILTALMAAEHLAV